MVSLTLPEILSICQPKYRGGRPVRFNTLIHWKRIILASGNYRASLELASAALSYRLPCQLMKEHAKHGKKHAEGACWGCVYLRAHKAMTSRRVTLRGVLINDGHAFATNQVSGLSLIQSYCADCNPCFFVSEQSNRYLLLSQCQLIAISEL